MDEWICGESPNGECLYVVHTIEPRFIAEFSDVDSETGALHRVEEIDPIPEEDISRLRSEAAEALSEWLDWRVLT